MSACVGEVDVMLYEQMAVAVIQRACRDYKLAVQKLKKNPNDEMQDYRKMEIEIFFASEWFSVLTDVNYEFLLKQLQ